MNIFLDFWINWTIYEKILTAIVILLVFLIIGFGVRILTKNNTLSLVAMLSNAVLGVLTLIILWFVNEVFGITLTAEYLIIPTVVLVFNILDISTFVTYYIENQHKKDFDLNDIKREFVKDTINFTIFITLFTSVLLVFLKEDILYISAISGGIALATAWINYYIFYRLVK